MRASISPCHRSDNGVKPTFLNILVGVDGSPSSKRALEAAIDLAQLGNAKLMLISVAPAASSYVTLAGVNTPTMQAELDKWAARTLDEASRLVPDEIAAHTVQATGHAGPVILKELERGAYDLVVLGTRGRGRVQEGFLGSVNGYVHFHSKVPSAFGAGSSFRGAVEGGDTCSSTTTTQTRAFPSLGRRRGRRPHRLALRDYEGCRDETVSDLCQITGTIVDHSRTRDGSQTAQRSRRDMP